MGKAEHVLDYKNTKIYSLIATKCTQGGYTYQASADGVQYTEIGVG